MTENRPSRALALRYGIDIDSHRNDAIGVGLLTLGVAGMAAGFCGTGKPVTGLAFTALATLGCWSATRSYWMGGN